LNVGSTSQVLLADILFFEAYYSNSLDKIERVLESLNETDLNQLKNKAYKGALLMKKAKFLRTPIQKIKVFKEGSRLLESVIESAPSAVLYRFLRLTIQENAPKILKYSDQLKADAEIVCKGYQKLSSTQQKYLLDYAKQSSLLEELIR
jgi:hypothetical protein